MEDKIAMRAGLEPEIVTKGPILPMQEYNYYSFKAPSPPTMQDGLTMCTSLEPEIVKKGTSLEPEIVTRLPMDKFIASFEKPIPKPTNIEERPWYLDLSICILRPFIFLYFLPYILSREKPEKWKPLYGEENTNGLMERASTEGNLTIIKRLDANGHKITKKAMNIAASNGHLEILEWLHANGYKGIKDALKIAAKNRHANELKCSNGPQSILKTTPTNKTTMDAAAKNGQLDVLIWLHENQNGPCTIDAMDYAAAGGHLNVVKWLHHNRTEGCTMKAMDLAAGAGHLSVVEFLHENRTEGCTKDAMDYAAAGGHLNVVKWLHHNRTEGCTKKAMDFAARYSHIELFKWMHENRKEGCNLAHYWSRENGDKEFGEWLSQQRST